MRRLLSICCLIQCLLLASCTLPARQIQQPDVTIEQPTEAAAAPTGTTAISTEDLVETLVEPTAIPTPTARLQPTPTSPPAAQAEAVEAPPRYLVQMGTPVNTANFVNPAAGCNWMGVGGQVFGRDEKPVSGLIVEVGGTLGDNPVLSLALTGGSSVLGPGGFEITLADVPIASQGTLWLQLFDLNGLPQSEKIYFDTFAGEGSCDQNLVIINFSELGGPILRYYLPNIFKDADSR